MTDYLLKQPDETFTIAADFSMILADSETIIPETSLIIAWDRDGNTATSEILDISSKYVSDGQIQEKIDLLKEHRTGLWKVTGDKLFICQDDRKQTPICSFTLTTLAEIFGEVQTVTGSVLNIRIKGGELEKSPYKIEFKAVTSSQNKWEKDVFVKIYEK